MERNEKTLPTQCFLSTSLPLLSLLINGGYQQEGDNRSLLHTFTYFWKSIYYLVFLVYIQHLPDFSSCWQYSCILEFYNVIVTSQLFFHFPISPPKTFSRCYKHQDRNPIYTEYQIAQRKNYYIRHSLNIVWCMYIFLKFIFCVQLFACMNICTPFNYLVPAGARRGCQSPRNWSYRKDEIPYGSWQ